MDSCCGKKTALGAAATGGCSKLRVHVSKLQHIFIYKELLVTHKTYFIGLKSVFADYFFHGHPR